MGPVTPSRSALLTLSVRHLFRFCHVVNNTSNQRRGNFLPTSHEIKTHIWMEADLSSNPVIRRSRRPPGGVRGGEGPEGRLWHTNQQNSFTAAFPVWLCFHCGGYWGPDCTWYSEESQSVNHSFHFGLVAASLMDDLISPSSREGMLSTLNQWWSQDFYSAHNSSLSCLTLAKTAAKSFTHLWLVAATVLTSSEKWLSDRTNGGGWGMWWTVWF